MPRMGRHHDTRSHDMPPHHDAHHGPPQRRAGPPTDRGSIKQRHHLAPILRRRQYRLRGMPNQYRLRGVRAARVRPSACRWLGQPTGSSRVCGWSYRGSYRLHVSGHTARRRTSPARVRPSACRAYGAVRFGHNHIGSAFAFRLTLGFASLAFAFACASGSRFQVVQPLN